MKISAFRLLGGRLPWLRSYHRISTVALTPDAQLLPCLIFFAKSPNKEKPEAFCLYTRRTEVCMYSCLSAVLTSLTSYHTPQSPGHPGGLTLCGSPRRSSREQGADWNWTGNTDSRTQTSARCGHTRKWEVQVRAMHYSP